MKNTDDFHYEEMPSCAVTKLTLFAASKDEWDTKENTGKSIKNALYVQLRCAQRYQVMPNSEKIKYVDFSHY